MPTRQPGVLIDDPAQPSPKFVIGPLPQRAERAARRHDRVIVYPVARTDLGNLVRHSGAAGDAVDKALSPFQHPVQHTLGRSHLPEHVHVNTAFAVRPLMGYARLVYTARDRVRDEFFMSLDSRAPVIDLRDRLTLLRVAVGIDP